MLFNALFRHRISTYSDQLLLDLVRKQNKQAEGEIFKRYAALVMGVCLKYIKNYIEAEDLMMTIFEELPTKIKANEIKNFRSWLYSVVRNECLMVLRKKNKSFSEIENTLITYKDESSEQLNLALLKNKKLDLLEKALKQLKPQQKKALHYFYLERKSYNEISVLTKSSLKQVKSLIQNGKRNLKLILEKADGFNE